MEITELRFLVVEDHSFQRWIVAKTLESLGAQLVISASDGQEALNLLAVREPPIDIIITDLDMPGMDGMEFIRHIGEGRYPASLIVASAMEPALVAGVEAMTKAYGVSLLGSIAKPLTTKKLEAVIRGYMRTPFIESSAAKLTFTFADIAAGLKKGQFEPFFQPKVDVRTQETKGAETLVRWRHPDLGFIRPNLFIETAEQNDLIEALTDMIIRAAAQNCAKWRNAGLEVPVSVNLSAKSLSRAGLGERLMKIVEGVGLSPKHMILEITESAAAGHPGRTLENLTRLRMRGFGLSIDDFGMGYSSLERLAGVPFTELKVDRSFVKHASTRAEWELVRTLGCDLAQGYYIARPMDAGDSQVWVESHMKARATA
jgi:EAL domain-containing protein (putative c-di-GMP-specific phosphodiesterase class I)/FixJ family two-component response regulator